MKHIILFFFVLILLLPAAFAETKIFSGKVLTDTDKVIDGRTFRFTYEETSRRTFVQTPTRNMIVEYGKCGSNGVFRVCINSANFSDRNITTYVSYYLVDATIYKLTGSLSAISKVTASTLLQNEPTDFTIIITNPTDFDIINVEFNEGLQNFSIGEVKGCTLDGTQIKWKGSLKSRYDITCTVALTANKEGLYTLTGNLIYFNGFETEEKTTDPVTIKVLPKQLLVNKLVDQDIEVNQNFYINMSLRNIHTTEKMDVSLTIEIPNNVVLLKDVQELYKDFNILKRSLVLEPFSYFNFSLYLKAVSSGNLPIREKHDYKIKNVRDIIENSTFINALETMPIINLSSEYSEIMHGQKFIVVAKLKNPSRVYKLTNIKAKLNFPYTNGVQQNLDKLMPNESYAIISNEFVVPKNIGLENNKLKLDLEVEYNFNGIVKSLNKSLELRIKQQSSINATQAKTNVEETKEANPQEKVGAQAGNKTAEQATKIVQEKLPAKKPKLDFSDKKVLFFIAGIFILIVIVPFIIYKARKRKKDIQSRQNAIKEESQMPVKPKDF